jgi:glycosyltransferase involved in cell wall biosynthesis
MKVAVVVTGGLHASGREQVVPSWLALFSRLARRHDVHAFALRHLPAPQSYPLHGYTVHDLGRPSAPFGLTRLAQEQALHREISVTGPFDLVHGLWGDAAGQLAVRMGRAFGIPSIVTFDSGEFVSLPAIEYGSQRTARGRRAIAEAAQATRVHVCSQFMAAKAARFGLQPVVIPLTTVTESTASRAPGLIGSGGLRLIQVASLSKVKNQQLLIDALAVLARSVDVALDLVGEDTLDGQLQERARDAGVAERVTFHGFVPRDDLPPLYAAADIYVQTSLHEAAGVSVLEAAAAGLPIVGTRAGYVAGWAPDRALAVDDATAESLAKAILALRADPTHAQAIAARAQEWSCRHDAASTATAIERLYEGMLTKGS